jgi:hypothetical protein
MVRTRAARFKAQNLQFYEKVVFTCMLRMIPTINKHYFPTYSIHRLSCLVESHCVLCEVRSEYLWFKQITCSFQGRLVVCFLLRRVVFDPRSVHVRLFVDEVTLGLVIDSRSTRDFTTINSVVCASQVIYYL